MGMLKKIYIFVYIFSLLGCSTELPKSTPQLDFYLDRDGTIDGTIFLNFEIDEESEYLVSFTSQDSSLSFIAPYGESTKISSSTLIPVSTSVKGEHFFEMTVYTMDGVAVASDMFEFVYKFDFINPPAISLSEKSSKDQVISLQISAARSSEIDQAWVEGDVIDSYKNRWLPIDILDQVALMLTPGEGEKNIRAKVRNRNGAESPFTDLQTSIDTQIPSGCSVELASDTVGTGWVNARFNGNDTNGLKYLVSGDVTASIKNIEFIDGEDFWIPIVRGDGIRYLSFAISDNAENYCLMETKEVTYESGYNPIGVEISGNPIYTYDLDHAITLRIDAFRKSEYQIYISGGVVNKTDTHTWMSYRENMPITLEPYEGTRIVYYKIMHDGEESQHVHDNVYLNPQLRMTPGAVYNVYVPNIIETETITLTGCVESYVNVPYQQTFLCTPAAASVSATMFFDNGTNLNLVENF
jgi:hypothetical protein